MKSSLPPGFTTVSVPNVSNSVSTGDFHRSIWKNAKIDGDNLFGLSEVVVADGLESPYRFANVLRDKVKDENAEVYRLCGIYYAYSGEAIDEEYDQVIVSYYNPENAPMRNPRNAGRKPIGDSPRVQTLITLDSDLKAQAKAAATDKGISLSQLVNDLLAEFLQNAHRGSSVIQELYE